MKSLVLDKKNPGFDETFGFVETIVFYETLGFDETPGLYETIDFDETLGYCGGQNF